MDTQSSARYHEASINTASSTRLVVMLYDGAIRFLQQSVHDIRKKDLEGKRKSVDRALAIMQQLRGSLNREQGAHIARELERLYDYIMTRISEGSRKLDARPLDEAVRLLRTLAQAWESVAEEELRKSAAATPTTPEGGRLQIHG
jgi:flagellar protein FliS